ncbi:MAG: M3 family metallopeptidase, partial [Gammaproteobacteria bacterium]|nr:M3 family metallopeptidase [Gammaproteobacteria bacterium]
MFKGFLAVCERYFLLLLVASLGACSAFVYEEVDEKLEEEIVSQSDVGTGSQSLSRLEQTVSFGPIGHLPVWQAVAVDDVEPGVRQLLAETESQFSDLEANLSPDWQGLMEPLERLEVRLGRVVGTVTHLLSVKYSDELQAGYDAVRPEYVTLTSRMSQSRAIYQGMVSLRDGAEWGNLNQSRRRILTESIRGMERAGVHLAGEAKARYEEIQERLSKLSNDFSTNLVKEEKQSRVRVSDPDRVAGVPAPVLSLAVKTALEDGAEEASEESGPWHFVVNGVNYMAVVQHGANRGLREEFYRAYRSRGTSSEFDNQPVLAEILRLRQEQSALVGFASYADRSLDAKMAPDTDSVWALFNELESAARPAAEQEFAALIEYMGAQGAAEADDPQPWDMGYWMEKLREDQYAYDSERLREYFQMP